MKAVSTFRFFLFFLTVVIRMKVLTFARTLSSTELAIGEWQVDLRCTDSTLYESIFPQRNVTAPRTAKPVFQLFRKRHSCKLSIFPNGTFCLQPSLQGAAPPPIEEESSKNDTTASSTATAAFLPMHGRWTLRSNPYCVTDRFYDDLILSAFPRVQKSIHEDGEVQVLRRLQVDLYCRLQGHYSHQGLLRWIRRQMSSERGFLYHGTLLQKEEAAEPWWRRRRVMASFTGHRTGFVDESTRLFDDEI